LFSGIWIAEASRAYLEARSTLDNDDWLCLAQNETSVLPTFFLLGKENFVAKIYFVHKIIKIY